MLSGGDDCVIRIWSSKTNQLVNQLSVHQKRISSIIGDHHYPSMIHSSSIDKSIHTYDLKTDKKVNFRQGTNGSITSMDQLKHNQHLGMYFCIKSHVDQEWVLLFGNKINLNLTFLFKHKLKF